MRASKNQRTKNIIFLIIAVIIVGAYFYFNHGGVVAPKNSPISGSESIVSVIVPHFDLYKDKRKELLKQVFDHYMPETVVVVSVDHFAAGTSGISTTDKEWDLTAGKVAANKKLVSLLTESKIATSNEQAFGEEHGIKNILPDIKELTRANVLPIIIKDNVEKGEVDKLADWIESNCKDCIVIASTDFSHYQPNALADIHDSYSISALEKLDFDKIWTAETDSPQSLYLAAKLAERNNTKNFNLFYNSNSGKLNNNDDAETTSVVLGYYSDKQVAEASQPSTSFVIAGDAMFDRNVWQRYNPDLKKVFDNFGTRVFRGSDVSLINLEGPVSDHAIPGIQTGGMSFNFQPQVPAVLKYLNIGEVSLANNHTNNAGTSGFATTKSMLTKSDIIYFGKPSDYSQDSVLRIPGQIPVTIIGIMALDDFDQAGMNAKIKSEKSAGQFVIIYPHWGEEYKEKHVSGQSALAKEWIAAGADMIVGSHPHVTEDFELIDGKPVVYSLGNFVFDQFFSQETQEGLVLAGTITKDKIQLTFLPTKEKLVKPEIVRGTDKTRRIKKILDVDSQIGFKKISSDTIEIKR
jgi:poly-gamma-glutamate synthesis protein (capsule biosynthesis protein)